MSKNLNLFTNQNKDEMLFNNYKKKVQKGGNYKNIVEIQYELANCYMNGIGVQINHKEALYYLKLSAEKGHMKSQYYLSNYYEEGKYIEKNTNEAFKWCKKSSDQNFDLAQNHLGCYYEVGEYIEKNMEEAIKLYKKSAEQGNTSAEYNLATCYEYGRATDKNMIEAFKWYKKSSENDYHRSQNKLGWFYENGFGTDKNITEAIKWYKRSSSQDNCKAHYNLGNCYKYNKGIEKHDINVKIAFRLYNRAIEQGCKCEDTLYEYALCYENGEGVEQNLTKAFNLIKQAADLEYPIACYKISEFYLYGKGININIEKSIKWYNKSISLGYKVPIEKQDLENPVHKAAFEKSRAINDVNNNDENNDVKNDDTGESYDCNDDCNDDTGESYDCNDDGESYDCNDDGESYDCNDEIELLKHQYTYTKIIETNKNEEDDIKKHLEKYLSYYKKKLNNVIQFNLYNKERKNKYDILYLRYNYNCGVINHHLGKYEKAITYYEEAAYNKYPPAQKALSYCYKNGIYYEKSLEQAKVWINLYYELKTIDYTWLNPLYLENTTIKHNCEDIEDIEEID